MTNDQLAERLDLLAAWRTPGGPRPDKPYPYGEHEFLRLAAERIRHLAADMELLTVPERRKLQKQRTAQPSSPTD